MSISRELFRPSKKGIWKIPSEQAGSVFFEGGLFCEADKVLALKEILTCTMI